VANQSSNVSSWPRVCKNVCEQLEFLYCPNFMNFHFYEINALANRRFPYSRKSCGNFDLNCVFTQPRPLLEDSSFQFVVGSCFDCRQSTASINDASLKLKPPHHLPATSPHNLEKPSPTGFVPIILPSNPYISPEPICNHRVA
jgi:hypothetical protein